MCYKKTIVLFFVCLITACAPLEQFCEQETAFSGDVVAKVQTGSESVYSKLQSDQRRILFGSVMYDNGKPYIFLSKEDALSLGITGDLYDDCAKSLTHNESEL